MKKQSNHIKEYVEKNEVVNKDTRVESTPSKPLIKLMKSIISINDIIPSPDKPDKSSSSEAEKGQKNTGESDEFNTYYNPIGIIKHERVIGLTQVSELTPYDHCLIEKGLFSKYNIYALLDNFRKGEISEDTVKEIINSQVSMDEATFKGYITSVVLDLIAAYMSYFFDSLKQEYPDMNTESLRVSLLADTSFTSGRFYRHELGSIYATIYSAVYNMIKLRDIITDENGCYDINSSYKIQNMFCTVIPHNVTVSIYDNIHIKLCTAIGSISYEDVNSIMTHIVAPVLESLHDALSRTLVELLYKLAPIFADYKALFDYSHCINCHNHLDSLNKYDG